MNNDNIQRLIYSLAACISWLFAAYTLATFDDLHPVRWWLVAVIAFFLTIMSLGSGRRY